ncbi:conserved hypothetical protein [Candidatus Koribacter versatilis Ellin345]|uniref:Pvc16 N-terminal domain-containing protein n=1 Tax=Koribacter versatilis (strain Ellin345) TaxID=204669 RepID=Q1ITD5_KORVE|nr:DUF4255 domain-containing protein [Candidatus Koribacter versatilis]ABF39865.1 conserved hypothetical protein [Candidatus Koribacter versatilis Ellin345]
MSNALALAAVTAVLQSYLNAVYNNPSSVLGSVSVTAIAPDLIQGGIAGGGNAPLQVNIFLHQVTLNAAWRNIEMPTLAPDGQTRIANQPLALDLHYLLTAYAPEDSQAEALLGLGVFFLHQNPMIARADIASALAALPPSYPAPFATALGLSGLADQVEMIKITPATLGREEIAWLWTALKADYRPTFPFQVSVVLIQPQNPVFAALPVLQRIIEAKPLSPIPTLTEADPPNKQPVACLGDTVTVQGAFLNGTSAVRLVNPQQGLQSDITAITNATNVSFKFGIPNPVLPSPQLHPTDLPAGVYVVSAKVASDGDTVDTNGVALAIAPKIDASWAPGTIPSGLNVSVSVPCAPYLRPGQAVQLLIGSQAAPADTFDTPTNSPSFTFANLTATATPVPVRLRVDGIDSPIIDMTAKPPKFTGPSVQVT